MWLAGGGVRGSDVEHGMPYGLHSALPFPSCLLPLNLPAPQHAGCIPWLGRGAHLLDLHSPPPPRPFSWEEWQSLSEMATVTRATGTLPVIGGDTREMFAVVGHGGATTTGPDATPPPQLSVKTCGGGGGNAGGIQPVGGGGGSCRGWGGGVPAGGRGGGALAGGQGGVQPGVRGGGGSG